MHVLIVAPEQIPVPPLLGGSVEISILAIARRLARSHRVTIVSRAHARYPRHSVIDGIHIYRVPTGSPALYLSHVMNFVRGRRFDLVQIDNRPRFVMPLKRLLKKTPVSLFLHSLTFVGPPYASKAAAAQGLSYADIVIANSSSLQQQLAARFPASAGKIRKVWLGVDTKRFAPGPAARKGRAFRLLFAGRVIPRKGLPVLLKAVKLAQAECGQPIHTLVAGSSTRAGYVGRMKSLARKLRVNARFLGTVPHSRIHRVYRQADAFVCPSQKHEAFGLVNVEAMSSGLPVIASRNGGIKEIVDNGRNGYLIRDYRRPRAFAKAIVRLVREDRTRRRMARQARQDCLRRFSWKVSAKRLSGIYAAKLRR
jgi:spore coat protein SA